MFCMCGLVVSNISINAVGNTSLQQEGDRRYYSATYTSVNPLYKQDVECNSDNIEKEYVYKNNSSTYNSTEHGGEVYLTTVEEAGAVVRSAMVKRQSTIEFKYATKQDVFSSAGVGKILGDIFNEATKHTGVSNEGDYLRYQYAGYEGEVSGYTENNVRYVKITYTVEYYNTYAQELKLDSALKQVYSELNLSSKSDFDKINAIYQYICNNVRYDYTNLNNTNYKLKYTAYAALCNGTSVCQGYANLMYRMMLDNNIDVRIISGTGNSEAHAWNIVKLGSYYYNMDATWDEGKVYNNFTYFMRSNADFAKHVRNAEYSVSSFTSKYPMASTSKNAVAIGGGNETSIPTVSYRTHVQTYGWQAFVSNGEMSGTSGQAKRLEGIEIKLDNKQNVGIQYTTHVQTYGWQPWSSNGEMSGTSGEAKRLEAIKIQLTGTDAGKYDVYYRVHAQSYGWLGWAKNGEASGTAGYAKRLEGIQVVIVKKGNQAPGKTYKGITSNNASAYISKDGKKDVEVAGADNVNVLYRTHVQSFGWQPFVYNGAMSGTSGKAKRLEGIEIKLSNKIYTGGITYRTHIQSIGWQGWKSDGTMSGTSGQGKRLEAIEIKLTGNMAAKYDVYYRVHAQSYGWLAWAKNGESAGTSGYGYRLEGIQIVLVKKGTSAPSASYGGIKSVSSYRYVTK